MSYLETKSRGKEKYTYFVKKWTLQNKPFVLRKYIGKDTGLFSKENYLVKNMNLLVDEELNLRTPIWKPNINFVYDPELVKRIEKKAITLNNLIEAHSAEEIMQFEFAK